MSIGVNLQPSNRNRFGFQVSPGQITIIPKLECFGDFGGDSLTFHHNLRWPTGGKGRYNLPRSNIIKFPHKGNLLCCRFQLVHLSTYHSYPPHSKPSNHVGSDCNLQLNCLAQPQHHGDLPMLELAAFREPTLHLKMQLWIVVSTHLAI